MKALNQLGKIRLVKSLVTLVAVTVFFSACSKDDNDDILSGEAKVMIVNSASGSAAQDFYLDNTKVNAQAVAYSQSTAYIATPAGYSRKGEFKNSGSTTANFTGYVDVLPNKSYTFFYTTKADGSGNSSAVFQDETTTSSTTRARVRFVNLASGFNSANFLITGGTTLASNVAFAAASTYNDVDPGTILLQTSLATGGTASANLGSFTLQAGKIYTIYTSGSLTATVSAGLITHN
ncbi:DUF4397 domain-containing protein [Daejeonella lutea]|uniref:DUF4397 domain-containing protein n=1 Tax=Daejeonella lutea TaxID=572036 RepID=A0A1T4ZYB7_9SPHI|nr:DUF4397 domain-containing protein [Daejeonella lutea]SKB27718.1 protein of unknown function [Daejeonella lutea]